MFVPNYRGKTRILILLTSFICASCANAAQLTNVRGTVEIQYKNTQEWVAVGQEGGAVGAGDSVRSGISSRVKIVWADGTAVELGPNSFYTIEKEEADQSQISMKLWKGKLSALVNKIKDRKFTVNTPTAVCSVRGTEFDVAVQGQRTSVDLTRGVLSVGDGRGNEVLLHEGNSIRVDNNGIGRPVPTQELQNEQARNALKQEVSLNMTKEAVLAAASDEIRAAEYQTGKTMIDVFGNRVRLEQYIMRPSANQFKLVVLNDRDSRFDYFYYTGTFNQTLPTDLSQALSQMSGCPGTACTYFMTGYETGRSNLSDTVKEMASGGHMVDVNSNVDTTDDVAAYFNSDLNAYVAINGAFYKTLFDNYSIKYNNVEFLKWQPITGTGITSYLTSGDPTGVQKFYIGDSGALGAANTGSPALNTDTHPDGTLIHDKIKLTYGTGTYWEQYDNYLVADDGTVATLSDFSGIRSGNDYKENMLKWNLEQVVNCNLFRDKIDIVVEPKTLIQSGLLR